MKKYLSVASALVIVLAGAPCVVQGAAAKKTATKSAINTSTTVRTRVEATGLYSQECYDAYYGCMDQFCIADNESGGSCACSDDNEKYEKQLVEIQDLLEEADRIRTEEVEKVQAGASADIIFAGERQYDEKGNVIKVDKLLNNKEATTSAADSKARALALFQTSFDDDDDDDITTIASKTGAALFAASHEVCMSQIPDSCEKDATFLHQVYSRQIVSDCKGFENSLKTQMAAAKAEMSAAQGEVRTALRESFESANKYNLGECMVEFKKCMQTEDACGAGWENCVSIIASENMQNNKTVSTAKTTVATVDKYDITASTMEMLDAKRTICERVLDQCMSVRDEVWPAFLREAAPTIKVAESNVESKFRQSCLTNISTCIQKACRDDIAGKGVDTMDACLSRPDMARSFCKVEIDPCERMEPLIWGYVTDKLAAMRVDACTQEVKDCFTADTRCGENFQNCIGMDYDYIHDICPLDSLVVCKANNPKFSMDDLDSMLMGLYLNIDNAALEQCQNLVDMKMAEICGSTTDCNRFAADDTLGTGSLRSQKDGTTYRVTGMISFGSIKMGYASSVIKDDRTKLTPGQIGVKEYMAEIRERNASVANAEAIFTSIEAELDNIAGTINRTIEMIEQDPQIQFCVTGRNLEQITGNRESTKGRFPNLLNQVKMQIAISALRKAQDNYNAKFNEYISGATQDASADLAQYMCQKIAQGDSEIYGSAQVDTPLAPPYAISYDVGAGLDLTDLTRGGRGESTFKSNNGSGVSRETTALFSRDTRNCHICTTVTTQSCVQKKKNGFLGIGGSKTEECTTDTQGPDCKDIVM